MEVERLIEMLDSMIDQAYDDNCRVYFNGSFDVNRVYYDDDGDLCLVSDEKDLQSLDAVDLKSIIEDLEDDTQVYFLLYDDWHDGTYFKIKSSWEFDGEGDAIIETEEYE